LGNFLGLGKGLMKICVSVSLYVPMTCENENSVLYFRNAEVGGSTPLRSNDVTYENAKTYVFRLLRMIRHVRY